MAWISTSRHNRELYATFFHLFESKIVQFRPYSLVLILRMYSKQFYFPCVVLIIFLTI